MNINNFNTTTATANTLTTEQQQGRLTPMLVKMKMYQHCKGDFSNAISMGTFEQPKVRQMTIEEFAWTRNILSHGWEYPEGTYEEIENSAMRTGEWMHWTEYRLGDFRITPLSVDSDKNLTLVEIHDFVEMKREYIWVPNMQSKGKRTMNVKIYTDGSTKNNPGPGGIGAIIQYTDERGKRCEKEITAGYDETTNSRMELMAIIAALESLNQPCKVHLFTDSQYITNAINNKWIDKWKQNGWKKSGKKPVKNRDLWERLLKAATKHNVTYHWIQGHNGNPENERCDKLASNAAKNLFPRNRIVTRTFLPETE